MDTLTSLTPTYLPWAIALFCYIEAGRRTWQLMFLTLPERSAEPLAMAVKKNGVPGWFRLFFVLLWGPIMAFCWLIARLQPASGKHKMSIL